jgi:hypothetical protein
MDEDAEKIKDKSSKTKVKKQKFYIIPVRNFYRVFPSQ